jgi:hypothetical protein
MTVPLPVWPEDVAVHPAAELFPLMVGTAFTELVRDIAEHGLTEPIVRTPNEQILDGRNRYRACREAGVEPAYETHAGEPWRYVISTNLHRRHLTDSQRATIAAKIAERPRGGWEHVNNSKVPDGTLESADLPPTREEAANLLNVSPRQVARARQVIKHGTESLQAAVESGAVPVATAARVAADLPAPEQDAFVAAITTGADPHTATPGTSGRGDDSITPPVSGTGSVAGSAGPAPSRSQARRRPLTDEASKAAQALDAAIRRWERLLADDRWSDNRTRITETCAWAFNRATDVLTAIKEDTTP